MGIFDKLKKALTGNPDSPTMKLPDQYLCIVPDRNTKSSTENIFLPFEGDNGLSIVLSKAFLLAADDKITDSSIRSQIHQA